MRALKGPPILVVFILIGWAAGWGAPQRCLDGSAHCIGPSGAQVRAAEGFAACRPVHPNAGASARQAVVLDPKNHCPGGVCCPNDLCLDAGLAVGIPSSQPSPHCADAPLALERPQGVDTSRTVFDALAAAPAPGPPLYLSTSAFLM